MAPYSHAMALGIAFLGLVGCGRGPAPAPPPAAVAAVPLERLGRMVDRYWDERAARGDPLSPQQMADSLAVERRYLAELLALPTAGLDAESRLTYELFKWQRELDIEGFTYPAELLPVDPFDGPWLRLARSAAATAQHPLTDAGECENWLRQIQDFTAWSRQAIANMREGLRRGYIAPRSAMLRALPLLERLGTDESANVLYLPGQTLPQLSERPRWTQTLDAAVRHTLLPAYRELHDFIQHEYLPRAADGVGLSRLPLGPSWYAYAIKRATGSAHSPTEIHALGLAEVDRLQTRLSSQPAGIPAAATKDAAELLEGYRLLKDPVLAAMAALFSAVPPADFEIRAADAYTAADSPLLYRPAAPGSPAVLYVNVGSGATPPAGVEISSYLQQALPGRHYQSALQQARAELPKFRRFGAEPAFVDGWALYAASLGEELGLTRDDESRRGAILGQLTCATALVVDTGLHALGWTREQGVDYLRAQLGADAARASLMVDRFVARPAEALACKMGELKIRALRNRAQTVLGARFDIREFHSQILEEGAMPLDMLDASMKRRLEGDR